MVNLDEELPFYRDAQLPTPRAQKKRAERRALFDQIVEDILSGIYMEGRELKFNSAPMYRLWDNQLLPLNSSVLMVFVRDSTPRHLKVALKLFRKWGRKRFDDARGQNVPRIPTFDEFMATKPFSGKKLSSGKPVKKAIRTKKVKKS